jgi:16S rRNA (cytidine1402-2'-O)-methyltransferase
MSADHRPPEPSRRKPREPSRSYSLAGNDLEAPTCPAGLYVVATPIGHLGDITLRALEILAGADLIACEDTRVTRKLLDRYGITTPLTPYHDHNATAARPKILDRLAGGAAVALVSDAGTPLVSDPGFKLVRAAREAGHAVTAAPGASAMLTALTIAGLPTDRFFFEGFLPAKSSARTHRLETLKDLPATLVIYEAGPRIAAALADLTAVLGAREAAVCRELTKLHEEVRRGDLASLARDYAEGAETRGEFVVVVAPPAAEEAPSVETLDDMLRDALAGASLKDAVAAVVEASGAPRREVYQRALALTGKT